MERWRQLQAETVVYESGVMVSGDRIGNREVLLPFTSTVTRSTKKGNKLSRVVPFVVSSIKIGILVLLVLLVVQVVPVCCVTPVGITSTVGIT